MRTDARQDAINSDSLRDERLVVVGICDDEEAARRQVRRLVEDLAASLGIPLHICEFPSAAALLIEAPPLDVLFLDIQMPHGNGIDAGRKLRELNERLDTILVTAFEEYAVEGYSIEARRFLVKPLSQARFARQVAPVLKAHSERCDEPIVVVGEGGDLHSIAPRDIVTVSTKPPKLVSIRTTRRNVVFRDSLKNWEDRLAPEGFFRCHSAFVVNMRFVNVIGRTDIELVDGERIPLSRHRRKAFIEAYAHYVGGLK